MKIIKSILSIVLFAGLVSSCKKDILDINLDPNKPTTASATPGLVLPAALNTTATIYNNPTADARFVFAGLWLGHISYSGNFAIATENLTYAITNSFAGSNVFGSLYDNNEDYDFIEKKGVEQGNNFYRGIGIFMKAYNFQTLVDLFNDVPYTEALQGTTISKPKYDKGKAIYDDIAKRMDTAIALFKISLNGSITGDIMFKGNPSLWLKFANTVKLRLLLRQSERPERAAYIQAELAKLVGASYLDVDASINPGYLVSTGKANPFFGTAVNVTNNNYQLDVYRAGQYSVNFFLTHQDPRVASFYKPVIGTAGGILDTGASTTYGTYRGNFFGEQGIPNSRTSEFGPGVLKSATQPSILMLAAESNFIQAEAALRGWISGNPKTLYETGVTSSFTYLGSQLVKLRNVKNTADSLFYTSAESATRYLNRTGDKETNYNATTTFQEKLAIIIRQKWAALTLINELEPYNDYRRLKLPPDVPLSLSLQSTGAIPNRLLYPQREYEVNAENVIAQGTVKATDKVWWMP